MPTLGFIGAGKVGQTLARLWHGAGYTVTAIHSRTARPAQELSAMVDAEVFDSAEAVIARAGLTFLTVPDDAINSVAASIATQDLTGKGVVHTSGAHSLDLLRPLAARGAMIGSIHPAFPFADVDRSIAGLIGATFALEYKQMTMGEWLRELVHSAEGRALRVSPGEKARYHAALVFASNYAVTLYHTATQLLDGFDADDGAITAALNTLLGATIENLQQQGTPQALTGPLKRGDAGTITAHLRALDDETVRAAYRALARLTYPMVTEVSLAEIKKVIDQDKP